MKQAQGACIFHVPVSVRVPQTSTVLWRLWQERVAFDARDGSGGLQCVYLDMPRPSEPYDSGKGECKTLQLTFLSPLLQKQGG